VTRHIRSSDPRILTRKCCDRLRSVGVYWVVSQRALCSPSAVSFSPLANPERFLFPNFLLNKGSAQIDVKISFKGRQPNKENAAKPFCRYVSPATALHMKRNVITLRIPSMKWSRYSVTNA
jgi:hypothetical protein